MLSATATKTTIIPLGVNTVVTGSDSMIVDGRWIPSSSAYSSAGLPRRIPRPASSPTKVSRRKPRFSSDLTSLPTREILPARPKTAGTPQRRTSADLTTVRSVERPSVDEKNKMELALMGETAKVLRAARESLSPNAKNEDSAPEPTGQAQVASTQTRSRLRALSTTAMAANKFAKLPQLEFVDRNTLNVLCSHGVAQMKAHWSCANQGGVFRSSNAEGLLGAVFGLAPLAAGLQKRGSVGSLTGFVYVPSDATHEVSSEHACVVDLGSNFARVSRGSKPRTVTNSLVFEFAGQAEKSEQARCTTPVCGG